MQYSLQSIGGPWTLKSDRELQAFPVTRQSVLRGGVHDQIWRRDWRLAIEQRNDSFQDNTVHKRISVRYACGLQDEPTYRSQRALVVRYVISDVMSVHVRAYTVSSLVTHTVCHWEHYFDVLNTPQGFNPPSDAAICLRPVSSLNYM